MKREIPQENIDAVFSFLDKVSENMKKNKHKIPTGNSIPEIGRGMFIVDRDIINPAFKETVEEFKNKK